MFMNICGVCIWVYFRVFMENIYIMKKLCMNFKFLYQSKLYLFKYIFILFTFWKVGRQRVLPSAASCPSSTEQPELTLGAGNSEESLMWVAGIECDNWALTYRLPVWHEQEGGIGSRARTPTQVLQYGLQEFQVVSTTSNTAPKQSSDSLSMNFWVIFIHTFMCIWKIPSTLSIIKI